MVECGRGLSLKLQGNLEKTLELDSIPDRIVGSYTDDFNIVDVHNLILKRFSFNRAKRISGLQKSIEDHQNKIERARSIIEKKTLITTIDKLSKELDDLLHERDIQRYLQEAIPLIDRYHAMGTSVKVVSFKVKKISSGPTGGPPIDPDDMTKEYRERLLVIRKYFDVVKRVGNIQLDVVRDVSAASRCSNCQTDLTELTNDDDNGLISCPMCGLEKLNLVQIIYGDQNTQTAKSKKSGYDDRENFYKGLLRYQGKQPNRLPNNLIDILDKYFISFGLTEMTSSNVKALPLNKNGSRGKTTKDMMLKALSDVHTGLSGYYEDLNLICHIYWGWKLPDISHLENVIMNDYDETQKIFEIYLKNGGSNINIQYRLFKHLQIRGHECTIDDFKMIKGEDILRRYDDAWEMMITGAAKNNPDESAYRFIKTPF